MVIDGRDFKSGYILFAAAYSKEAVKEAKHYCEVNGYTQDMVRLKMTKNKNTREPILVLVEVK